jgi:hypothetical protein
VRTRRREAYRNGHHGRTSEPETSSAFYDYGDAHLLLGKRILLTVISYHCMPSQSVYLALMLAEQTGKTATNGKLASITDHCRSPVRLFLVAVSVGEEEERGRAC